ncbi:hypothetical protein A8709_23090 [Paenibacillus pectinilyticus]|uniref:Uncharacterized protein n=1 Tax=Paenibacillus pectinilyticus TaxID=512399 RepID=A0A1C0ZRP2_9BACL|nr:hypothetical protein [Paenibacillus pectinilyticus]OCT10724.1 hypothetical protein A8709_23090 [Paenibacillus pectinilyticus]
MAIGLEGDTAFRDFLISANTDGSSPTLETIETIKKHSFNYTESGDGSCSITNLNIAPHGTGTLVIPARNWQNGDILNIKAVKSSKLFDEYNLSVETRIKTFPAVQGPAPSVTDDASNITVSGSNFSIGIPGAYGTIGANFTVSIDGAGLVTTGYSITNPIAEAKETGVIYDESGSVDQLSWDRKGL